ncbi:MAG TPA: ThuA domain-containing protein [Opitutaceae bacterium]
MKSILAALAIAVSTSVAGASPAILVFSKTAGFRHDSIPDGIAMLWRIAGEEKWAIEATEDAAAFTAENLARFDAIVFLSTTQDVLTDEQMAAMRDHLRSGRGFVGIHAASDTEYGDEWYARLIGAQFARHPKVQENVLTVHKDCGHPSIVHLGDTWTHTDEWYDFRAPVANYVTPLLSTAATTYPDGKPPGGDHPISWFHEFEGGRVFYTGLGHTSEAFSVPEFVTHVREGLRWAMGK